MKQVPSLNIFRKFGSELPIISECTVDSDRIAILKLRNDDEIKMKLVISNEGYPKRIKEIISGMASDMYSVILAPYITEQTAEICKKADVGFLDLAGNCYIAYKSIYVEIKGNKNENKPGRAIKSVYERSSVVSSVILRILLENINRTWRLKELAQEAGCSIGQVSKVKDFLVNQAYVNQSSDGISVINPKSIMYDWAKVYSDSAEERIQCYSMLELSDIEERISKMKAEAGIECLLTGFSGGVRYQPVVRYQKVHALIDADNLDDAIKYLELKRVDSGANVIFIVKYNNCVGMNSRIVKNSSVSSPIQVFLDCMSLKGRGEEMAEAILNKEICK
ncbi:MAG: hypothetical protein K6G75_02115 [Lachnospiraceae bacterium]|nr:hypothetical protein [Lachnospiraceae bacterium]